MANTTRSKATLAKTSRSKVASGADAGVPAPKRARGGASTAALAAGRLVPPPGGAVVRMYRIGHGDCFLIAFEGPTPAEPRYVLIDCGYKPGSPGLIHSNANPVTAKEVVDDIRVATGGHLHVAVITHEHQDHVNGITDASFKGITIDEAWFAWTEDHKDDVANRLRAKFKDQILGLLGARQRLTAVNDTKRVESLDAFLSFELGGGGAFNATQAKAMLGAKGAPGDSLNKRAMKLIKDRSARPPKYIRPHQEILTIPGCTDLRVFALGPPRDPDQLRLLDPEGGEGFGRVASSRSHGFAAAATGDGSGTCAPFEGRFQVRFKDAVARGVMGGFAADFYGRSGAPQSFPPGLPRGEHEIEANPEWRRIDKDWLYSSEQLALDMNSQTNNASLVLAFELGRGGKVLLFAADAQRGNWRSWSKKDWSDGEDTITARDLLARTVLYKVGHHGSHNATLKGTEDDDYPNLSWMGRGEHAREFTAMITAVRAWAETQKGWDHPLKEIKEALLSKTSGRVFQTDTDFTKMGPRAGLPARDWTDFTSRTTGSRLFFDYRVTSEG